MCDIKGFFTQKLKSFTQPHIVPNLFAPLFRIRYLARCSSCFSYNESERRPDKAQKTNKQKKCFQNKTKQTKNKLNKTKQNKTN